MELFRKAFLFVVGIVVIAFEEASKSIDEATKTIEGRRVNHNGHKPLAHPIEKMNIESRS